MLKNTYIISNEQYTAENSLLRYNLRRFTLVSYLFGVRLECRLNPDTTLFLLYTIENLKILSFSIKLHFVNINFQLNEIIIIKINALTRSSDYIRNI